MAKGSPKKPGPQKCRGCGGILEGTDIVKTGKSKWHRECAVKNRKYIPKEYLSAR